jgi:hypothetical protein
MAMQWPWDERVAVWPTEHFVLQSKRSATIGEANRRAAVYLSTVSSALVAFGFLAQLSSRLGPVVAAVLPALLILGEFTFVRLADTAIEIVVSLHRIQRIHGYYRSLVPEPSSSSRPLVEQGEHGHGVGTPP